MRKQNDKYNSLKSKYSTVGVFLMSHNWKTREHYSHWNFEEEQKRVDASPQKSKIFFCKISKAKSKKFSQGNKNRCDDLSHDMKKCPWSMSVKSPRRHRLCSYSSVWLAKLPVARLQGMQNDWLFKY